MERELGGDGNRSTSSEATIAPVIICMEDAAYSGSFIPDGSQSGVQCDLSTEFTKEHEGNDHGKYKLHPQMAAKSVERSGVTNDSECCCRFM